MFTNQYGLIAELSLSHQHQIQEPIEKKQKKTQR